MGKAPIDARDMKDMKMVVESHYSHQEDANLAVVLQVIPQVRYVRVAEMIRILGEADPARSIGHVTDTKPRYYTFEGECYLLRNGVAQVGLARTVSQELPMIRLFANSMRESEDLHRELGL
jgi:hypothetical protein